MTPHLVTQYLLNQLSEQERERMQDRIFEEAGFVEELEVAEREILDAYVRGSLPAALRKRVESELLFSPVQLDKLQVARALNLPPRKSIKVWLISGFAAALLFVAIGAYWQFGRPPTFQRPGAQPNARIQANPQSNVVATFLLSPGAVRGRNLQAIQVPAGPGLVRLDFESPTPEPPQKCSLKIFGPDGQLILRVDNVASQKNGYSVAVRASSFRKGLFHAVLDVQPPLIYYFTVQ